MFFILFVLVVVLLFVVFRRVTRRPVVVAKRDDHAIVIGGSIAGMATAAYLRRHFRRVTIIESDDVFDDRLIHSSPAELLSYRCDLTSSSSLGRSSVNHSYQIHVLQGEGRKILFELFPKLEKTLLDEHHAYLCDLKKHFHFVIGDVLLNRALTEDLTWFCIDRFTLETIIRREISQFEDIHWISKTKVSNLIVDREKNVVLGVQCPFDLRGDLICDCSGRFSSSTKWLKQSFDLHIPEDQLHVGIGYVSFVAERFRTGIDRLDSIHVGGLAAHAPKHNKGFLTMPIRRLFTGEENSLGFLANFAVYCLNGEYPPDDSFENLLQWVKEHLPSDYYSMLKSTEVRSPLLTYRGAFDQRKYVERVGRRWPKNFVLVGDSMCSFNPKNGQGMTHACRQARQLDRILRQSSSLVDVSLIYNRQSSSISDECWLGSATNDWVVPNLRFVQIDGEGTRRTFQGDERRIPLFSEFLQWYTFWLIDCAARSGELTTAFLHVVFQHKSPYSLLRPKFFFAILSASLSSLLNKMSSL